jgi:hypothetical protein
VWRFSVFRKKSTDVPSIPSPVQSKTVKVEAEFKRNTDSIMTPDRKVIIEVKREDAEDFEIIKRSVDFSENAHGNISVSRWRII